MDHNNGEISLLIEKIEHENESDWSTKITRDFIRKVYGILSFQLLITLIISCCFNFIKPLKIWLHTDGSWLIVASSIGLLVCVFLIICLPRLLKEFPQNYFFLFTFTLFESLLVASLTSITKNDIVIKAALGATLIIIGLTTFALQTKYDFTSYISVMFILSLILLNMLILTIFFKSKILEIVAVSFGLIIFSIYLIIDTQQIAGKGKYKYDSDDYILAALMLYIDFINIFTYLIRILRYIND